MIAVVILTTLLTVTRGGQVSVNQNLTQEQCTKLRERLQCEIWRGCYFDKDGNKVEINTNGQTSMVGPGDLKSAECVN